MSFLIGPFKERNKQAMIITVLISIGITYKTITEIMFEIRPKDSFLISILKTCQSHRLTLGWSSQSFPILHSFWDSKGYAINHHCILLRKRFDDSKRPKISLAHIIYQSFIYLVSCWGEFTHYVFELASLKYQDRVCLF